MRHSLIAPSMVVLITGNASSSISADRVFRAEIVVHGGGCRESSTPGQCCHMETRMSFPPKTGPLLLETEDGL
jgi:hypothetical protein